MERKKGKGGGEKKKKEEKGRKKKKKRKKKKGEEGKKKEKKSLRRGAAVFRAVRCRRARQGGGGTGGAHVKLLVEKKAGLHWNVRHKAQTSPCRRRNKSPNLSFAYGSNRGKEKRENTKKRKTDPQSPAKIVAPRTAKNN